MLQWLSVEYPISQPKVVILVDQIKRFTGFACLVQIALMNHLQLVMFVQNPSGISFM